MSRFKLTQPEQARLPRLLRMKYTPKELADELGADVRKIRESALRAGCPHEIDGKGRVWIIGEEFEAWYRKIVQERKQPMGENEAWCLRCREAVPLTVERVISYPCRNVEIAQGKCPFCQATVNRARKRGQ